MITIREYKKEDKEAIHNMIAKLHKLESKIYKRYKSDDKAHKLLQEYFDKGINNKKLSTKVFVALDDKKVIGFCYGWRYKRAVIYKKQKGGYVSDCFVDPKYRNKGIGRKLVKNLLKWFKEKKVEVIHLHVLANNKNSKKFWESFGFDSYLLQMEKDLK